MKSLLLFAISLLAGCASYNRVEHRRALEQFEQTGSIVRIDGDSAFAVADLAMERAGIWLHRNSTLKVIATGADTIASERPSLTEFGYRIIRADSPGVARLVVEQRSFGGYFDGLGARRLAWYMASGVDMDSTFPPPSPRLTALFFELGGEGLFLSLNIERFVTMTGCSALAFWHSGMPRSKVASCFAWR